MIMFATPDSVPALMREIGSRMEPIDQVLDEISARLTHLENQSERLRAHVHESGERQRHILAQMQEHAEAMRRDAEAMRRDAEAMQRDAEAMQRDAVAMRRDAVAMHQSAGRMWVEVGRYTSVFDQVHAAMREDVQYFQGNIAKVVDWISRDKNAHQHEHADLTNRVENIERKLAG